MSCAPRLPAAIPAASAIAAVTVPASAPASTATPASTAAAPAAEATTTSTAAWAASATTALTRGTRFVDDNVATHEIMAVQTLDGALGFLVAINLYKSEPAWLPRETVAHQGDIRCSDSRLRK
jgi:hypothetical protein